MRVLTVSKSALIVLGLLLLVMIVTAVAYFLGNNGKSPDIPQQIEIILPGGDKK